ncbi:FUSC family protein [Nocardioides terrisoli]|uniref:FUSC family protein n=1 Tax=Nocardioides terrisoli TaxID=3388267 RepID=UPI00287BC6FF|nr:FUSC family protein [Nocardioides marmorisolisilvae]
MTTTDGDGSLLARGRVRMGLEAQDAWDRFVASDPGQARLHKGLRAVVAVGTTIVVQLGVAGALGVSGQTRALHLMLGSLIAMNMSTVIRPGTRRQTATSAVWAPVAAALGATLATVTAARPWLALSLFVLVCFAAVWVRRYGARWFAGGFIVWQAYFFTLYLHPPISALPGLLVAAVASTTWVTLLLVTVLHQDPGRRLRRTVTALRARARSVVSHCLDVLRDPGDERRLRNLRAQLVKLSEVTLLFDGQLSDVHALPSGTSAARLRRWIVEVEISSEELASAAVELAALPEPVPPATLRLVEEVLELLGWGELDTTRSRLAALRQSPHDRIATVRRLANAADTLLGSVADWMSGHLGAGAADETGAREFEPVLALAGDTLPGTAVPAGDGEQTSSWSPASWAPTTRQAVQAGTAAALAIIAGELISHERYYWAVIAAFVAFTGTATVGETVRKSMARIGGTLAGLVVAVWVAQLTLGHSAVTLTVLLACIFLAFYFQAISYAAMIFFITLMLGELYGILHRFSDSVLLVRLAETAAGAAAGILVSLFVLPTSTRGTLIEARRGLLDRLAVLADQCALRLRGDESEPGLLTEAIRLDEAARQLVRNADSMMSVRGIDADRSGRRYRVQVLGVCASTARSMVPAVLSAPPDPPVELARACEAIATEARRLADIPDLRDQPPSPDGEAGVATRVSELVDAAVDPPLVLARRIRRLADSLALLTPRGRGR